MFRFLPKHGNFRLLFSKVNYKEIINSWRCSTMPVFYSKLNGLSKIPLMLLIVLNQLQKQNYQLLAKLSAMDKLPYSTSSIITNFFQFFRIKEVDWIPYFTTQLVDDLATHLRLFKQARSKLKSANHGNLETYFFDLEFTLEHGAICRDHICMNTKEEKGI